MEGSFTIHKEIYQSVVGLVNLKRFARLMLPHCGELHCVPKFKSLQNCSHFCVPFVGFALTKATNDRTMNDHSEIRKTPKREAPGHHSQTIEPSPSLCCVDSLNGKRLVAQSPETLPFIHEPQLFPLDLDSFIISHYL